MSPQRVDPDRTQRHETSLNVGVGPRRTAVLAAAPPGMLDRYLDALRAASYAVAPPATYGTAPRTRVPYPAATFHGAALVHAMRDNQQFRIARRRLAA